MPRIVENRTTSRRSSVKRTKKPYQCRLCTKIHPLRTCKRFLAMNIKKRKETVKQLKYCTNCLAHKHSQRSCLSTSGCHKCNKKHHTLLHSDDIEQIANQNIATLPTDVVSQRMVTILPTIQANIFLDGCIHPIRILIDTASTVTRISTPIVRKLGLSTSKVGEYTMCHVVIRANSDRHAKIRAFVRVDNRISLQTPIRTLPSAYKDKFFNMVLADPTFYEKRPVSMIFGADLYAKIILGGVMPNHEGLPMAQNSTFGWLVSGTCPLW